MPDLSMSTLNLVFAGLSITCAVLSGVMFVLARRAARTEAAPRTSRRTPRRAERTPARRAPRPRATVTSRTAPADPHRPDDEQLYDEQRYDDQYDEWRDDQRPDEAWADDEWADDEWDDEAEQDEDVVDEWHDAAPDERAEGARDEPAAAPRHDGRPTKLPRGAEAALWAITEAIPDPRNHLVLKDPTSELRVLGPIDETGRPTTGVPSAEPAPAAAPHDQVPHDHDTPAAPGAEADGSLREGRMRSAIDETDVFTGEFFFAGEPRLNRF